MSTSGGTRRSSSERTGGSNTRARAPWQMTYDEFIHFVPPTGGGDSSRAPGDVAELRSEGGLLSDYTGDRYALNDFLGRGYDPRYDMSHLAGKVIANAPLKVYRATTRGSESEIWPGAYVTLSHQYAVDHGEGNLGGKKYDILTRTVRPDELVAMNPNEFFYVPRVDLRTWHENQVRGAVAVGFRVPAKVRAEYGL